MKAHICDKRPNFTCNLCGTMVQSNDGLNGHFCGPVNGDRSKMHKEEVEIPLESEADGTEEPIALPTKQEPSELKRAKHWQRRTKNNSMERKSDENQFDEQTGKSLKLQQR